MLVVRSRRVQFILALGLSSLVSIGFFVYRLITVRSTDYNYMIWNLCLAWLPLVFAVWLGKLLRSRRWGSWLPILVSLLWFLFLPNSFYMISDFIHLQDVSATNVLYDAVLLSSFIFNGVLLGLCSVVLLHLEIRRYLSAHWSGFWAACMLLVCGFGIYIGRDLRWNSWDVLTNPGGLLFDISDRFLHPSAYPQMFMTTIAFFSLLGSLYYLVWRGLQLVRRPN